MVDIEAKAGGGVVPYLHDCLLTACRGGDPRPFKRIFRRSKSLEFEMWTPGRKGPINWPIEVHATLLQMAKHGYRVNWFRSVEWCESYWRLQLGDDHLWHDPEDLAEGNCTPVVVREGSFLDYHFFSRMKCRWEIASSHAALDGLLALRERVKSLRRRRILEETIAVARRFLERCYLLLALTAVPWCPAVDKRKGPSLHHCGARSDQSTHVNHDLDDMFCRVVGLPVEVPEAHRGWEWRVMDAINLDGTLGDHLTADACAVCCGLVNRIQLDDWEPITEALRRLQGLTLLDGFEFWIIRLTGERVITLWGGHNPHSMPMLGRVAYSPNEVKSIWPKGDRGRRWPRYDVFVDLKTGYADWEENPAPEAEGGPLLEADLRWDPSDVVAAIHADSTGIRRVV